MNDNNESVSNSLQELIFEELASNELSENINPVNEDTTTLDSVDNTVSSINSDDEVEGIIMVRPTSSKNHAYIDKFYPWSKISKKLGIKEDELRLANIFDYMKKYKSLKSLLSKTLPLFINDGSIIYDNVKITEIEGSPIMLLKDTCFRQKNNLTNNYPDILSNLLSSGEYNSPEALFGNLINAMTSGMELRRVDSIENNNDLDEESDEEVDEENIVNDNSSLNIVNQLLSMYRSNSTNIQTINDNNREKYKDQIEQMKSMGLTDENKILQAITVCDGNVEHAVNYYFGME